VIRARVGECYEVGAIGMVKGRFWARPSRLSLPSALVFRAAGSVLPNPTELKLKLPPSHCFSASATAPARCSDRVWL
jgi:hypothetical protein